MHMERWKQTDLRKDGILPDFVLASQSLSSTRLWLSSNGNILMKSLLQAQAQGQCIPNDFTDEMKAQMGEQMQTVLC